MVRVSGWLSCCTAWVNEVPDERFLLISATHAFQEVCSFCQGELSLLTYFGKENTKVYYLFMHFLPLADAYVPSAAP